MAALDGDGTGAASEACTGAAYAPKRFSRAENSQLVTPKPRANRHKLYRGLRRVW